MEHLRIMLFHHSRTRSYHNPSIAFAATQSSPDGSPAAVSQAKKIGTVPDSEKTKSPSVVLSVRPNHLEKNDIIVHGNSYCSEIIEDYNRPQLLSN